MSIRQLRALDSYPVAGGRVFIIESPIEAPRDRDAYQAALGRFAIDGVEYVAAGFEWKQPATPIAVGEHIGIVVRPVPSAPPTK